MEEAEAKDQEHEAPSESVEGDSKSEDTASS